MKKKATLSKERRERYINNLIEEAVINVLAEQEPEPLPQEPQSPVPPPAQPSPQTNAMDPNVQNPPEEEFTVDVMVDKVNVIRGGKSFSDPEVYGRIVTYFNSLSEEEKMSINKFLTDFASVVIDATEEEVEQSEPVPPSSSPSRQAQPPAPPPPPAAPTAPPAPSAPITPSNI